MVLSRQEKALEFETLRGLAPGAAVQASTGAEGKGPVRFTVEWNAARVMIQERGGEGKSSEEEAKTWNDGLLRRVSRFPEEERGTAAATALREALPAVKRAYSVVLPQGFDSAGTSTAFLLSLADREDGFIVWNQGFYDRQGFRILGGSDAPLLGRRGGNFLASPSGAPAGPGDYFPGVWRTAGTWTMSAGARVVTLRLESEENYEKDGAYTSTGTLTFTFDSPEAGKRGGGDGAGGGAEAGAGGGEGEGVSVGLSMTGGWRIGRDKQLITAGDCKTGEIKGEDKDLRELLELTVAELLKENGEPDESWLISRDPDTLYLEGRKLGLVSEMRRKKNAP